MRATCSMLAYVATWPCLPQGGFSTLNLFVIPVAPGRSRVINRFITTMDNPFIKCASDTVMARIHNCW